MSKRLLILSAFAVSDAIMKQVKDENPNYDIVVKNADGINVDNLPHASKVIVIGKEYKDIVSAFEDADIKVSVFSNKAKAAETGGDAFDVDEAKAYLTEKGVAFNHNLGAKKLKELVEKTKAAETGGEE